LSEKRRDQPVLPVNPQAGTATPATPSPPAPPRRTRRIALAVAVGLVAGTAYVGLRGAVSDDTPAGPPSSPTTSSAGTDAQAGVRRAATGGALLQRLAGAITAGDRARYDAVLDPDAPGFAAQAGQVFDNLRALPVANLVMRYVSDDPDALPAARRRQIGGTAAWVAQVEVSWRLKDYDQQPIRLTVPVTLVTRAGTTYVASFNDLVRPGQRRPFWLLGRLDVVRGERSLVISSDPKADVREYARVVDQAIDDVSEVWGAKWSRRVVLYLPGTQSQMEYILGARQNSYGQIAAVTTAEAAERVPGVPVRIVVNPNLFAMLGVQGRRIVLTHETTHVASNATASAVPLWLAEGFADYVAFTTVNVSTSSAARELFKAVRAGTGPKALPEPAAFAASSNKLAIAYESSWLACRLIATEYGRSKLVDFYRTVHTGNPTTGLRDAFRTKLGTTQDKFVSDWLRYLQRLAGD
jgi:hypothetical protein